MQSTRTSVNFPGVGKKIKKATELKLREMAKAAGFSIQAEMNRQVETSLTREADQGDTNNLARALFSKMKGYSGARIAGKFGSVKMHPTKYSGGSYKWKHENFGKKSLDRFSQVVRVVRKALGEFQLTWYSSRLWEAVMEATKVQGKNSGEYTLKHYVESFLNYPRVYNVFNNVMASASDIVRRTIAFLSRRHGI